MEIMPDILKSQTKLKKVLKLWDVYAIATGTTLSAGFFLLPGIAALEAGSAIVLAYLLAVIPIVPAMFSIIELATAMPRAGGVYYFLDRTLGPLFGTIGGLGTWLALILKVSFALVGMGAYLAIYFPDLSIQPIAVFLALALGALNLYGAHKSGKLQVLMVFFLIIILISFVAVGIPNIEPVNFQGFFNAGYSSILSTAGLVCISYVGITNVASLSEEVENPEKNLPAGVLFSISTAFIIYGLGTFVLVGTLAPGELAGSFTPVAASAKTFFGDYGRIVVSVAALLAFTSVANAGIMSASRYPLAMGRDKILSPRFDKLSKYGTPHLSLGITVCAIVMILLFLDPVKIAKLASAFQLLIFAFICLAVIVMRESRIESYDPGYRTPFYPWMQIFGIICQFVFIVAMGSVTILFSLVLIIAGVCWYFYYVRKKVARTGAIYHVFERLGRFRYEGLDRELRGILKEKGLREDDPFDEIIARSHLLDIDGDINFEDVVLRAAVHLSQVTGVDKEKISKQFLEGTRIGATPVTRGMALPHCRVKGIIQAEMVLVRAKKKIVISFNNPLKDFQEDVTQVSGIFFFVSPEDNPTQHLRILAQLAERIDSENFYNLWLSAGNEDEIKKIFLADKLFVTFFVRNYLPSRVMIGSMIKDLDFPKGCLVAMIHRKRETVFPKGNTILQDNDRLTVIGNSADLDRVKKQYKTEFDITRSDCSQPKPGNKEKSVRNGDEIKIHDP